MSRGIDLSHIYSLRNNFTIIGLTGQIGSGCSEVAEQLAKGFNNADFETPRAVGVDPESSEFKHNSYRKYRIVYNYAKENFKSYSRINYKNVLLIFLLKYPFNDLLQFLQSPDLKNEMEAKIPIDDESLDLIAIVPNANFDNEIELLRELKDKFNDFSENYRSIEGKQKSHPEELSKFFFSSEFTAFCEAFYSILRKHSRVKRNRLLQIVSNNLRKSGNPFSLESSSAEYIFTIVELINAIIKSHRKFSKDWDEERTQIVIDDLRSPIEIMYFKQRYAAFYTLAVNRKDSSRDAALYPKYQSPDSYDSARLLFKQEYNGAKSHEFYKANISECIQQADIHVSFLSDEEAVKENIRIQQLNSINKRSVDITSPYFSWKMQLLKYVSLISHPGLITPSPEERCMQMAFTAKHNSGCISRHVGAAITDENYSIKAIGWNNTPSGQIPCVLRNAEDLLDTKNDIASFTDYEKSNGKFLQALELNFKKPISDNKDKLKGRNVCFCFKDVKNSCSEGKNQVHTRSLHAEESAFLQITKYGGVGIENGKLFTTASPCELCAKKEYQLGIKVIYYIDPYPGISMKHILSAGRNPIEVRLFNGAIGNAYHWLYDPIMPYKNELTLLLGNKISDYASQQKAKADQLEKENIDLKRRIEMLEGQSTEFGKK